MKLKLLFSVVMLFLFINTITYAQASFTGAGIAVQGIARDGNNTAIQNQTITIEFEFYYFDESSTIFTIGSLISKQVLTDNFGVFSTIIDPNANNNQVFSNNEVWLRIKKQGDTNYMSESKLMHVPYAISANNGVPTGSIMPFVGEEVDVPIGWALCNGDAIPTEAKALAALLAPATALPDLQGTFLRGTGTSAVNGQNGPVLNETQDDGFEAHNHAIPPLTTDEGEHSHIMKKFIELGNHQVNTTVQYYTENNNGESFKERSTKLAGKHRHTLPENTEIAPFETENRIEETRPVNYGVNYIIKL